MRVLAIDPGYDRLGVAVLMGSASKPEYVYSDCIQPAKGEKEARLATVFTSINSLIQEYKPDLLSLETLFFMNNAKTALGVAEARGAILSAAGIHNIPVKEYSPQQIKMAVTGNGAADKIAVMRMIPHLILLPEKKRLDDEMDALALGICALSHRLS